MTNVQVQCCHCKGEGQLEHYRIGVDGQVLDLWACFITDPFTWVICPTCNGFGVVIATELKRVEKWQRLPAPQPRRGSLEDVPWLTP